MTPRISRRRFLEIAGLSTLGIALEACTSGGGSTTTTGGTLPGTATTTTTATTSPPTTGDPDGLTSDAPFSVWEDMLEALKSSPDHFAARADSLAAAADPRAIFAFVRDEILTTPPGPAGFRGAAAATRGGLRSVLRTGRGTPREKVELLADLLRRAGLESRVLQGLPTAAIDTRTAVLRAIRPGFDPTIDEERVQAWLDALGMSPGPALPALDPDSAGLASTAALLLGTLPDLSAPEFDWAIDGVPLVEVTVDGAAVALNPIAPDMEWGDPGATSLIPAGAPVAAAEIGVALMVATTADPSALRTVVEGSWPLDVLTGRRVVARFIPEGDPEVTLGTPAMSLPAHTAVLAVDGPGVSLDDDPDLFVSGETVTVDGSRLSVSEAGDVQRNDAPFVADPLAPSMVAALAVTANASAHPFVRLRVEPTDGAGNPVIGLPAEAISVTENGAPVPFMVARNRPPDPVVLFVLDTSASIPDEFRAVGAEELGAALVDAIGATHPAARYRVAGIGSGNLTLNPAIVTDAAAMRTEVQRVVGFGSDVWSALAQVRFSGATLVVLVSDGRFTDAPEAAAAARSWIGSGPPIVCLAVGDADVLVLEDIAALSGGAAFPVAARDEAVGVVTSFLDETEAVPVEIAYVSPAGDPGRRSVEVAAGSATASAEYEAPEATVRLRRPGLSGIYVAVRSGGREVVRTIAGVPFETATRTTEIDEATQNDVAAALFGWTALSVEASPPTFGAWLDDALVTRRTWRSMLESIDDGSPALEAVTSRLQTVPSELPALHTPLAESSEAMTFEAGPRMVLLSRRPLWLGGEIRRADILPFTTFFTVGTAPAAAAATTLQRSLLLAAAEDALFDTTTGTVLAGRPLVALGPFDVPDPGHPHADLLLRYAGWHRLLPGDDGPFAFWAVDPGGTVIGVLPDGSGGGATQVPANDLCKQIHQAAALADLAGAAAGMPFAYGAFVALGKAIAKQAIREAAIIASLGGPMPDTRACGKPSDFPCDVAKSAVYDHLPYQAGKVISTVDNVTAAGTGDDLVNLC